MFAPVPRQDSAALAEASIVRCNPAMVFPSPLTVMAAMPRTVNIKSTSAVEANRENTFKIDPYTLVDAAVTWRHGPLRATLAARNLFNEEYYWNADGETADPGRPRQILFTISVGLK